MSDEFDFKNVLRRMDENRRREAEEIRRLTQNPTLYEVARHLQDNLEKSLMRLCNYGAAVDTMGNRTDISDVMQDITEDARREFLRLTGREYEPEVCRTIRAGRNPNA